MVTIFQEPGARESERRVTPGHPRPPSSVRHVPTTSAGAGVPPGEAGFAPAPALNPGTGDRLPRHHRHGGPRGGESASSSRSHRGIGGRATGNGGRQPHSQENRGHGKRLGDDRPAEGTGSGPTYRSAPRPRRVAESESVSSSPGAPALSVPGAADTGRADGEGGTVAPSSPQRGREGCPRTRAFPSPVRWLQ